MVVDIFDREIEVPEEFYTDIIDKFKVKEMFTKPDPSEIKQVVNDKIVKYDISDDDDDDIKLIKYLININNIRVQDFANHFGNSVGYNTYNSLKHRHTIQTNTLRRLTWMLGISRIVGAVDVPTSEDIYKGAKHVIVVDNKTLNTLDSVNVKYEKVTTVIE